MENKYSWKLNIAALIIGILPLATFVPVLFHMTLADGVRSAWALENIFSAFLGLILSIICVKNRGSRNMVSIISTIISSFWVVLMCGIIVLAILLNFIL